MINFNRDHLDKCVDAFTKANKVFWRTALGAMEGPIMPLSAAITAGFEIMDNQDMKMSAPRTAISIAGVGASFAASALGGSPVTTYAATTAILGGMRGFSKAVDDIANNRSFY